MGNLSSEKSYIQIDIGDGEWVKVPSFLSYKDATTLFSRVEKDLPADEAESERIRGLRLVTYMIKEWNVMDGDKIAEISEESIERMNLQAYMKISQVVMPIVTLEKKSNDLSEEPPEESSQEKDAPSG